MDIIDALILQAAASPWLLLVMFASALIDGFFPPIPSETVLIAAVAVAMSTGDGNILLLCAAAALGATIGDNIAYALGRALGTTRFAWMRRPRPASAFDRARRALDRNGAGLILGARYIPVGRVAVNMSAGALGYSWRRFLPLSAVGGITWAAYSAGVGMLAGHWLKGQPLLSALIGVGVALLLGVIIDRVAALRRRRATRLEPATTPDATDAVPRGVPAEVAG